MERLFPGACAVGNCARAYIYGPIPACKDSESATDEQVATIYSAVRMR